MTSTAPMSSSSTGLGITANATSRNNANGTGSADGGSPASFRDLLSPDNAAIPAKPETTAASDTAGAGKKPARAEDDADGETGQEAGNNAIPAWVSGLPLPTTAIATAPQRSDAAAQASGQPGLALPGAGMALPSVANGMPLADAAGVASGALPTQAQFPGLPGAQDNADAGTPLAANAALPAAKATALLAATPAAAPAPLTAQADKAGAALAALTPAMVRAALTAEPGKSGGDAVDPLTAVIPSGIAPAQPTLQSPTAIFPPALPTPDLHGDNFDDAIGARLNWMADQKIGHAHIRISPQDLGPVEVQMRLDGNRVHADFLSAQPEVRHALENSLPRLREMLDQQGFQLAQANVGQGQQQSSPSGQGQAQGQRDGTVVPTTGVTGGLDGDALQRRHSGIALGLLDAYA